MYAVIKTGGKQYRVQPGDLIVVEKLAGEPGEAVAFGEVLLVGDGEAAILGSPVIEGASVTATLIETRKGEKIKIFKKIRRQGYRRTGGHRQLESVLRVTQIAADGKSQTWDGEVDLTPRATLVARSRGHALPVAAALTPAAVSVETLAEPEGPGKARRVRARVQESASPTAEAAAEESASPAEPKKAPKKAAAKKAGAAKTPSMKDVAKGGPKAARGQAKGSPVRRTAPRSGKS